MIYTITKTREYGRESYVVDWHGAGKSNFYTLADAQRSIYEVEQQYVHG